MEELKRFKVRDNKFLVVVQGDITEENVDAIVNAANSRLKHGGGVAGAILRKGGKVIQDESDKIGYCPVGKAVVTSGGNLKAKYVIHAVGPVWGEGDEENKLKSAVLSALEIATEKNVRTISLPAISTGIFGYPKGPGTKVIFDTCINFLKYNESSIGVIRLCNIDKETCDFYLHYIEELEGSEG
ncbi:MAG TPA: macro domain-containing protein [Candidatus Hydrothermia bacterium]|nr:macro domain-containing protein [Candidatus Hydrothermae bacterium]MDD3649086.1 macro domain-containing protein [Candidatus Hydrothermia bacterium]HOK23025.1 macro domain-containing protein [Candidatus Hydrothermia bacterium]HOL23715.1 macro domain-containing protein [Candidatus Hydrothermia bacterium]HOP32131.1 macro domain-containing protein [Candidatus Hydrothermia bacterium]